MDSLYLFANAGVQGTARMMGALTKSKTAQAVVASAVGGTVAMNFLNGYINQEEYDKIDDGVKERNMIIMHPDGTYTKIPLPYGYNVFKVMGDAIYDSITGKKTMGQGVAKTFIAAVNAFNPLSSTTFSQMISPTITDPFVQASENKNWRGAPIKPEQKGFQPDIKESSKYFSTVRPITKSITDAVNKVTGGTELKAGYVDVSPEIIDHFIDYFTGGTGKFVMNIANGTYQVTKGEVPEVSNIPFARTFYGKPSDYRDTKIVYEYTNNAFKEEFTEREKRDFYKSLDNALKEKQIDDKEHKKLKETFEKGQKLIELSKEHPEKTVDELKEMAKPKEEGRSRPHRERREGR